MKAIKNWELCLAKIAQDTPPLNILEGLTYRVFDGFAVTDAATNRALLGTKG